jgi:TDG/mug DNA glycosylase family protein
MILPDVMKPGLRVAFWATLHQIGLTPRELRPGEYAELLDHGVGLTDICKVRSGSDREVGTGGFDVAGLVATLECYAPAWIAFNGKNAAKGALGRPVDYGEQPERLGPARVFVLPVHVGGRPGILGRGPLARAGEGRLTPPDTPRFRCQRNRATRECERRA